MRRSRVISVTVGLAALLAACAGPPQATTPSRKAPSKATPKPADAAAAAVIFGVAKTDPRLIAKGGGNLLSNNAAGIVANHGGNLVSNNSGGLVSNNSGGLVSNNAAGYKLLATDLVPAADVETVLVDAFGRPVPGVAPTRTDAQGNYKFTGMPTNGNWIVEVRLPGYRQTSLARADRTGRPVNVTPASTIVTEHLRTVLDQERAALRVVPVEDFRKMATEVEGALATGDIRVDLSSRARAAQAFEAVAARSDLLAGDAIRAVAQAQEALPAALANGTVDQADLAAPPPEVLAGGAAMQGWGGVPALPAVDVGPATGRIAAYVAGKALGASWDAGFGPGVHAWHGLPAQRFYGGAATEGHALVVDGPTGPHLVRNAFYDAYVSGGLCWSLGAPTEDEVSLPMELVVNGKRHEGPMARQRFERGELRWTESSGVVSDVPGATPPREATDFYRYPPVGLSGAAVSTYAGSGKPGAEAGGKGVETSFDEPWGLVVAPDGGVFVTDTNNGLIRRIGLNRRAPAVGGPDGKPLKLDHPRGLALGPDGGLYVAAGHQLFKVPRGGAAVPLAGAAEAGFADGAGAAARFQDPRGVALDGAGNLYVADMGNHRVRKVSPAGVVTTLAGGEKGPLTDGAGDAARFSGPTGIAVDGSGTAYVADSGNHAIRRVAPDGTVTTISGTGAAGSVDGSGKATAVLRPPVATFAEPMGLALTPEGDLWVTEAAGNAVRMIAFGTGTSFTLAGTTHVTGFVDGTGDEARFSRPIGIAIDRDGQAWVADSRNHRVRKVVPIGRLGDQK